MKYYSILILFFYLILSGCAGEEYSGSDEREAVSSSQCLRCHGDELVDTHYDDTTTPQIEGYVLDNPVSWANEGTGYVLRGSDNACYASCHNYHYVDSRINKEWYRSGHGDINSSAFTYNFSSGACLRCHSGIGYASYVDHLNTEYPQWTIPTTDIKAHHITCNACHDVQGYPSKEEPRLRKSGDVEFISGSGSTVISDARIIGAGPSATCITCHQGRESGWSLFKAMTLKGVNPYDGTDETIANQNFVNPHYLPAGAMLFSYKGYEFQGGEFGLDFKGTYSTGIFQHQVL